MIKLVDALKKNGIVDLLGVGVGALAAAIRTFPRRFRGNVRRTRCRTNIVRAQVTAIVNDKVRRFTTAPLRRTIAFPAMPLVEITCPGCEHSGFVTADRIPGMLRCSACGFARMIREGNFEVIIACDGRRARRRTITGHRFLGNRGDAAQRAIAAGGCQARFSSRKRATTPTRRQRRARPDGPLPAAVVRVGPWRT